MVNLGTAIAYLDLDTSRFNHGISSALSSLNTFTQSTATASDKVSAVGAAFTGVGQTLTTQVTLPLMGVATAGLKVATDFEKSMSGVRAITGATGKDFEALEQTAVELGATTAFSANEVANAMTEMAKAGWSTSQIIDGMAGVLDATAASGENLETVATIVADSITGFGLAAKDSGRVADLLTQAANSGTIGIYELGESFKYIAPIANSMNYSIEDVTTALTAFSTAGIKGSQAGTTLRTMVTRLVKPTDTVEMAMERLNIQVANADGTIKPLNQLLAEMRVSFAGLTDEQKAYEAAILAGQEGMSGLLTLMNMSQEEYDKISESMQNASGVAGETAAVMQDNLQSSIEQLGGAMESLSITLGKHVIPYVRDFVIWLTTLVEKFVLVDEQTQKTILVIAGIAAAIGPVMLAIGGLITHIGSLMGAITTLKTMIATGSGTFLGMTGPVGIVVAAITGLIAVFVHLYKTSEEFREGIHKVIDNFKTLAKEIKSRLEPYIEQLKEAFEKLAQAFQPILEAFGEAFITVLNLILELISNLVPALDPLMEAIIQIVDMLANVANLIVGVFTGNEELVTSSAQRIIESIKTIFNSGVEFIQRVFSGLFETLKGLFDSVFGEGAADEIFGPFIATVGQIIEDIKSEFGKLVDRIVEAFQPLKERLQEIFVAIGEFWKENGDDILNTIKSIFSTIMELAQPLIDFIQKSLSPAFSAVADAIEILLIGIDSFFALITGDFEKLEENSVKLKSTFGDLWENLKTLLDNFITAWVDFWESVGAKLQESGLIEAWVDFWEGFGYKLYDIIENWKADLKDFFVNVIPNLLAEAEKGLNTWWENWKDGVDIIFSGTAIDGSHADGLRYVPFDGYIAELHRGERVLTAEENANYSQGGGAPVYNQYIIADTKLDRYEIQKDTEDLLAWGGVRV